MTGAACAVTSDLHDLEGVLADDLGLPQRVRSVMDSDERADNTLVVGRASEPAPVIAELLGG